MARRTVIVGVLVLLWGSTASLAVWIPADGSTMHYPQLPDMGITGLDVQATPTALADDFQATQSGPLTRIILWGSWLNDDVRPLALGVAIFSNIPANGNVPFGRPGQLLWSHYFMGTEVNDFGVATVNGQFYNPVDNMMQGADSQVVQYELTIEANLAFPMQKGVIYWLSVQRSDVADGKLFGWKTSGDGFESAAVFLYQPTSGDPEIRQLQFPISHPYVGQGMNLAFVVVPEPTILTLVGLGGLYLWRRRHLIRLSNIGDDKTVRR
jgi:hypothetical protein